jgi:hypothetical protein
MGRKTYLGGSTVLRFSHLARDARLESGPNSKEGEENVKRAARKKRVAAGRAIEAMDGRDAQRLAKRRAEKPPDRSPSN